MSRLPVSLSSSVTTSCSMSCSLLLLTVGVVGQAHADSMSALIAQKSAQPEYSARYTPAPTAKVSTRSTIQRASSYRSNPVNIQPTSTAYSTTSYSNNNRYASQPAVNTAYRYPDVQRQAPRALPAFLSGNYDNIDSEYLPLLSSAEMQSNMAAREVVSTARKMALNERAIIQGGCWDYLDAVFKRAGVTRDTVHKGTYGQGPYANSSEIEVGDWLYYINHGYNGVEHSGLFVGWVDKRAKQALILSYAGENRREPARYRVYDLSNVYQIMRPSV